MIQLIKKIFHFYYDGFSKMPFWGRRVWLIILIKLFIMFAILKLFFFPDFLNKKFSNDKEKGKYVMDQIIK
jgi:hypothetical protein